MADKPVPSTTFVIMGATGDLSRRKLLPALARLAADGYLDERCHVLGVARDPDKDEAGYQAVAREAIIAAGIPWESVKAWVERSVHYHPMPESTPEAFKALASRLEAMEKTLGLDGNRTFYMALPPAVFTPTVTGLGEAGLNRGPGYTRLVIEKPFGSDLASARALNALVHRHFDESQIYRIDHYLGKETVQNLLVFRFSNAIFESLWNRDRIESVQITVGEDLGLEGRGRYYDKAGALRDMVQNHLTQLVTLIAMEVPSAFEAEAIRYEKVKVLRTIKPIGAEDVVFGQYGKGKAGGVEVPAYKDEPDVAKGTRTETFVGMKLELDSWRWQGVPFYVRSGKRLARRLTEIAVIFRKPPVAMFQSLGTPEVDSNVLLITLQPEEGFSLLFDVKAPGDPFTLQTLPLRFSYGEAFGPLPEAYETLIVDVLTGNQTLFVHADEVETSWGLYTPLLGGITRVYPYAAGSWGPPEVDRLLSRQGHIWQSR